MAPRSTLPRVGASHVHVLAHDYGDTVAQELLARQLERWVGALTHATVPLRLVDGTADPVSGAHMVARYRELVPHADVVELRGVGHYPQIEDAPGVLRAFLEFHADGFTQARAADSRTLRSR